MKQSQHLQKYEFRCDLLSSAQFKQSLSTIYLIILSLGSLSALALLPVNGQAGKGPAIHDLTTCNRGMRYNSSDTFHVFVCEPVNIRVLQSSNNRSPAKPVLPSNSIQHQNNSEGFDPRDITTEVGNDHIAKESDPIVDIKAFGARAVRSASGFSTTANCNKTKSIKLDSATYFQDGDGITIYGCGSKNTLFTPGAPTVVPSIASGGTTTGIVTNSPKGSATVSYKVVARDKFGALTGC